MNTHVSWKCSKPAHLQFSATVAHIVHSKTWCPACEAERRRLHPPKPQITRETVENWVSERGGEIVAVIGEGDWKGLRTRLRVRCADFHEWDVTANSLIHATSWCPECLYKGERIVRAIFEATFGEKFPKLRPSWLASATGRKLELDGYSERLGRAFEYQGPHHIERHDVKETDELKRTACLNHGVQLIEVIAIARPFPPTNVLEKVAEAFRNYGIPQTPVLPTVDVFARELNALRQLARQKGGELVTDVYCGSEPHEWRCDKPNHPSWRAEPWRIRAGNWCPSCAGNRRLGIEELREWGVTYGLELLDTAYLGNKAVYQWRCNQFGHVVRRSKGNIQQSLTKGHPACNVCGPGIAANVLARNMKADEFANQLLPIIEALKVEGHNSYDAVARQLNKRGVVTARGAKWHASTVKNLMNRVKPSRP